MSVAQPAPSTAPQSAPSRVPRLLGQLREVYASIESFDAALLEKALKDKAKELGVKAGALIHPLRLAMTGKTIGPSLYHLLEVLGREKALARIDTAAAYG